MVLGTVGYVVLGFSLLDALYQTVTTVTTVGFREVEPLSTTGKVFTMALIVVGVGTAFYTLGVVIETLLEDRLPDIFGRRRMKRRISAMKDHVIVCGWGRVGRAIARELVEGDAEAVIIDNDPDRLRDVPHAVLFGDATEDQVLEQAGIRQARALNPDLFIVGRVRVEENEEKLRRAGADRVVNPQSIGGARMAAFVLQPHVTEFLDVVMHDRDIEFRLEEVAVPERSPIEGASIREAHVRDRTGALVLALRDRDGTFTTNPVPETLLRAGQVVIAIGTPADLDALEQLVTGQAPRVAR